MKLVKIMGLGVAAAALAAWIGGSTASAKAAYKTATGKDCLVCHKEKPCKKDNLTAAGTKFQECMKGGSSAKDCTPKP